MTLPIRPPVYKMPTYSLTGDLLSFLRCRLQYRFLNGSSLPPSRPVQLWFGNFIHGVLEEAFRRADQSGVLPPWPEDDIINICDLIEARLAAQGKSPRNQDIKDLARVRAAAAINILGPDLFPIIEQAEVRLQGLRYLPKGGSIELRSDCFEVQGVVDVLTSISLGRKSRKNRLVATIQEVVPALPSRGEFEIIVDYKGMRRPSIKNKLWEHLEWQINTYAWLRGEQAHSQPVAAGVLIFINELAPSKDDLEALLGEVKSKGTDVMPSAQEIKRLKSKIKDPLKVLSEETRLSRALRVIPIDPKAVSKYCREFDRVVKEIEECVTRETQAGAIMNNWEPPDDSDRDEDTCAACDFRHFCQKSPFGGAPFAP